MGKITKAIQPKHKETLSPWLQKFVDTATTIPLCDLPSFLATFPTRWPFPRGDLYHWIPLLNRFDEILDSFCQTYKLNTGPQSRDFGCEVLLSDLGRHTDLSPPDKARKLSELGYGEDGDAALVVTILKFTQMLLDHCGNRSIYASSTHLNDLLNSTDFSVICATLEVGVELAQRYQASVKRINGGMAARQVHSALLSNHYNIDLDRVQQLAQPFAKTPIIKPSESASLSTPGSTTKGKDKFHVGSSKNVASLFANDLGTIAKADTPDNASSRWNGWADIKLPYYPASGSWSQPPNPQPLPDRGEPNAPSTPTPLRRSNTATGPQVTPRTARQGASEDTPSTAAKSPVVSRDDSGPPGQKSIEIPQSAVTSSSIYDLLSRVPADLPKETRYEFLNRIRVAKALTGSVETRRQALKARLLAIQNLAYIHVESTFIEKVLSQDSDEPRRFQLVYQLAELIHPGAEGATDVPLEIQSVALSLLEAISGFHSKVADIFSALNASVNHGVLLYIIRKAVSGMKDDDAGEQWTAQDEWRDNLFSLILHITMAMAHSTARSTPEIISAGLLDIMVEILNIRSNIAERTYGTLVGFLDSLVYNVQTSFQPLVNANGLDAITNLVAHETELASSLLAAGEGTPMSHRSQVVDYEIPFYQQQNLKFLLKFIHHLMSNAFSFGGNTDRLLRNLVDKSELLRSIRDIIENKNRFGSLVWTNAVTILSDFLNNDPTSFSAIFEAGLIQSYLQALTGNAQQLDRPKATETEQAQQSTAAPEPAALPSSQITLESDTRPHPPPVEDLEVRPPDSLARGILPSSDPIASVPNVLNAISLNNHGMKMVVSSRAFDSFFEIFESPEHVRAMATDETLAHSVGSSFDELARHHPALCFYIANAVLDMVARVTHLARVKARESQWGAKLLVQDSDGRELVADQNLFSKRSPEGKGKGNDAAQNGDADVQMLDANTQHSQDAAMISSNPAVYTSIGPYIYALSNFLSAYITNSHLKMSLIMGGGIELLLDLCTSPSLPHDFGETAASRNLQAVISQLVESSPIIGLPSLLKRTQAAIDVLDPIVKAEDTGAYFRPFLADNTITAESADADTVEHLSRGTSVVKALLNAQLLIRTLYQCFPYSARAQTVTLPPVNVFDYYSRLVKSLGPLLSAAILEEAAMSDVVPQHWTRKDGESQDRPGASGNDPSVRNGDASGAALNEANLTEVLSSAAILKPAGDKGPGPGPTKGEQSTPRYKNYQTLRDLLHALMPTTFPLFQTLGKALLPKREKEVYIRVRHVELAEELAKTLLMQLQLPSRVLTYKVFHYWIIMLHAIHEMLVNRSMETRSDRPTTPQIIAPVLMAFQKQDGIKILNLMLVQFKNEICKDHVGEEDLARSRVAVIGMKKILDLFAMIVNGKVIAESLNQVNVLPRRDGGDRRAEQQLASNLVLELRTAILPVIRELWDSRLVEKGSAAVLAKIISILKSISAADCETFAYKRSDKNYPPRPLQATSTVMFFWTMSALEINSLISATACSEDLAREALYRAFGNRQLATEYCTAHRKHIAGHRNPIPEDEAVANAETESAPPSERRERSAPTDEEAMLLDLPADLPEGILDDQESISEIRSEIRRQTAAILTGNDRATSLAQDSATGIGSSSKSPVQGSSDPEAPPAAAKEDLDAERASLRSDLIDRCLDVIRAHPDSTHEVSELISAIMVSANRDDIPVRQEIGETLVNALMSFALDDDLKANGRSIAAYAHLLSLLLQEKSFFTANVSTLKENVGELLRFLPSPGNTSTDELAPWIPYVLLVFEILLSDDEQPRDFKWKAPQSEKDVIEQLEWTPRDVNVKSEDREALLDSILEILPRIGKEESLAVSVLRILVILSRERAVALKLGDKKNLQRLFVTAKQLSGLGSLRLRETRVVSNILIILRHVVEDDETIKQLMRREVRAHLGSGRNTRPLDVPAYVRHFSSIALRDPALFVEVSNEMLRLNRWGPPDASTGRGQGVILKDTSQETPRDDVTPTVRATEDLTIQDVKPSTEGEDKQMEDVSKSAITDKRPVIENPDGVIHFLLCELLNYKEVDDMDSQASKGNTSTGGRVATAASGSEDADSRPADSKEKKTKASFKAEEHPIFIYRCFILHCLTELLQSYNRTKVEFINFKRSAPLFANTPVKPRSSVLNYLLTDLLYPSPLDGPLDTLVHKKKHATAIHTQNLLVALVAKTSERPTDRGRDKYDYDEEPDLLFVRKFVLDTILKSYKDASSSSDAFDLRYTKMLALAEVMHLMTGDKDKDSPASSRNGQEASDRSQAQIRRLMYEKGYLAALTASIADIDLAFPPVKRTIKYILRVLRILTSTAIQLSHSNIITSAPAQDSAEDELVSASSLSDIEDNREETPDLYRNSALGMMEPGREMEDDYSENSEDDDDEEMYDDEYDDDMGYESEDREQDVSDREDEEDEGLEGMGPIEGLSGDHGVIEVTMDDDEDEEDDDEDDDMDEDDDDEDSDDDDTGSDETNSMDDHIEIVDDEGNPVEDDGASGWESETDEAGVEDDGEEIDYEVEAQDLEEAEMHEALGDVPRIPDFPNLLRALDDEEDFEAVDELNNLNDHYIEGEDEDDDDEEDDEDEYAYEDDFPNDPPPRDAGPNFDWDTFLAEPHILGGHPHRHRHTTIRNPMPPLSFMMGPRDLHFGGTLEGRIQHLRGLLAEAEEIVFESRHTRRREGANVDPDPRGFGRGHRHDARTPNNEDGTNPLLRRANNAGRDANHRPTPGNLVRLGLPGSFLGGAGGGGGGHLDSPMSIISDLLGSLPVSLGRHGHSLQFQITGGPGADAVLPLPFGIHSRESRSDNRRDAYQEPLQSASFSAESTIARWAEEVKMIFGMQHAEKSLKLVPAILHRLVPPAIEQEKERKAKEAELERQLEEERRKLEEEERKAQEDKEAEEKAAQDQREAEERERAAAEAAVEAQNAQGTASEEDDENTAPDLMEGIETAEDASAAQTAAATDQPRAFTTIRGEQVDITELGIDADYLEALPEEFREEVIAQTVSSRRAEARSAQRGAGEQQEVFQEFLDALPDDLRDEIVQTERSERRRRDGDEARRRAAASGQAAEAQDMDPASILMTLSPSLRDQVLAEQGADIIESLPPDMAAQVRRQMRPPVIHPNRTSSGTSRPRDIVHPSGAADVDTKPLRKPVVQMLDRSGVATLLRLMFINVKTGSLEGPLRNLFKDICENRLNRFEVVSTLLQILQDGSTDVDAVERSFAQLSVKAKQPKEKDSKVQTPQGLKRTFTNVGSNDPVRFSSETSPLLIVQQCLDLLCYLANQNVHVPSLFLTEHDSSSTTLKRSLSRKGKGKDSKASKYAINSLLALLDRELVMESSTIMDSLSQLLSRVTYPLLALDRKQKEAAEAIKKLEAEAANSGEDPAANLTDSAATGADNANQTEASGVPALIPDSTGRADTEQPAVSATTDPVTEASKANEKKEAILKRVKQLHPPSIPVPNLTLIVNIFVARECSSTTFKETLSTIKNLSVIPGALLIFGQELARQAQLLSEKIVNHLDELLPHIENAASGTEIQGVALSKFSPGASDQNKLLRVLTALDHLFAQKKSDTSAASGSLDETKKQDLLATLYRNPTFNALWEKLSACLRAIRQRESLINVATILLPLIEALMVVCKDTAQSEAPPSESQTTREMVLSSPQPESHMAGLFFTFTEEHRRILNELVRNNPSLMKGTFSNLVKNPKVLEFDNKRNWFNRSVHNKQQAAHRQYPTLQLQVRRDQVFHDSFKSLYFKSGEEMKFGKLSIRFHGEEGVDAGGVSREWFGALARQMFNANYALFVPVSSDRSTYHPNKLSSVNDEHLMFFKFIGRIIGKALYEGRLLDCYFSRAVYKRILGKPVSVKDMESFDPDYYKSLSWMLNNDITDIITETFSVEEDEFGVTKTEDLCENGRNIPVTEDNKSEYVRLIVEHKLLTSVKDQLEHFLKGFHEIIPAELISIFNEQELELLISGLPDVDIDDWKSNTEYHNYTPSSSQIQWFWRAVRSFDKEERAKLLQFVTGTSKVPLNGFKVLEGMNGINRFNIHRDYGNKDRLPSSHTCFNQLDLPEYETYDALRRQLIQAITTGNEYFGFA
ncbi:hypothetical protein GGR56DRAFT_20116 [Xylariaceae sp. FL0804]|nr:hypothetical protein GGR56DRAFT_20116 [Xylariaceae sp. FL0804]